MSEGQRRLAAIMFTDMVGYTALGQRNEFLSLALVEEQRKIVRPILTRHNGREVKTIGDAFLVEFPNAVDAVRCSYDIQRAIREFNISLPDDRKVHLRIGVHLGDVVESGGDISGDAVNVASRIEPLAEEGGVTLSRQVYDQVANKVELAFEDMGPRTLKNVDIPVGVYKMMMPWEKEAASEITEANRIAVLPFRNMSPDPNDEYFAEGMTEEIISTVSGISGLSVISRTSVMRYKQTTKSMTEIGRELKVGKLLEGSVRKSGNRIRITVQLIDAGSDAHIWAQSYDRSVGDVFETQSDIARKVAEALKLPSPRAGGRPENTDVYTLYLKARSLFNRGTREANEQAILLLEDATKIDSESARAFAGLANCYTVAGDEGWMGKKEAYPRAGQYARRALELDDKLPEAHGARGYVTMIVEQDYHEAGVEFQRAISLNPNYADAHTWYGWVLRGMGRLAEALDEAEKAYELDPLPSERAWLLGVSYYFVGRYEDSLKVCSRLIQTEPGFSAGYLGKAVLTSMKGDREEAYRNLQTYRRLTNEVAYNSLQARIEAHLGNKEESSRLVSETFSLIDRGRSSDSQLTESSGYQLSFACALNGDNERFFQIAGYLVEHQIMGPGELNDPAYEKMREDPRFAELFKKLRKSYGIN